MRRKTANKIIGALMMTVLFTAYEMGKGNQK